MSTDNTSKRKQDHIELAFNSQVTGNDTRFAYEPVLAAHPGKDIIPPTSFAGKTLHIPVWVSSMTGGTDKAGIINRNLARACAEFGMGIGLGSCRIILDDDTYLKDFAIRKIAGDAVPVFANLGIAQIEQLLQSDKAQKIAELTDKLEADGLIIHINPLQEWLQPEGDTIRQKPIDTIRHLLDVYRGRVIVKEVGQGFGPESLKVLMQLPLEAVDFGAHGGTNFAMLELLRDNPIALETLESLTKVGHSASDMLDTVNTLYDANQTVCKNVIISGGIKTILDGYYMVKRSRINAIYGQASGFLKHAMGDYEELQAYCKMQVKGLQAAYAYLKV